VHPFDDSRIIAGQGTAALELLAEVPRSQVIGTPVGGGGLIGGTRWPPGHLSRHSCGRRRDRAGRRRLPVVPQRRASRRVAPRTIADGLRGSIGVRNFELLRRFVDDVVTVSEAQIVEAMRIVLADFKLLIEPSSAVAVAAVLAGKLGRKGEQVGLVISGGNLDLDMCPFLRGERL
jgi:threonine dehydratase